MTKYKLFAGYKLKSDAQLRAKTFRKRGETAQVKKAGKKVGWGLYSSTLKR